jgi:UDP-GlcNAc:undecaprenyl-phosphate/decaprenyl-phosphate GlcNAc-1-phosphate transferase
VNQYVLAFVTVFVLSTLSTWAMRRLAPQWGWVEQPRANRWHRQPTAKLGGLAIYFALASGTLLFAPVSPQVGVLLALTTCLFLVGLVDDLIDLRPQSKLVAQIAGGLLLYVGGFHFNTALPWMLDLAVVVFWVVAITNAMNLLDNMDGLCAGVALIAGVFRFLLYQADGNETGAMLSLVFAGAVAGFLIFNFSPATIFMGDCGAFAIGFFLAALNLTTSQMYAKSLVSILFFPFLVLALPIFDTAFVSVVRWFSGRRLSEGAADHTSHRLVAVGLSERRAVLILYTISGAAGTIAYLLYRVGFSYAWFGLALTVLGLVLFGIFLSSISVYPEERAPLNVQSPRTPQFRLTTEFLYKRAVLWVLVDVLTLAMAYYLGFFFRYGQTPQWDHQFQLFARSAPLAIAFLLLGVSSRGLYRTDWQTFSLHEVRAIASGTLIGMGATLVALAMWFDIESYTLAVLTVSWGAAVLMLAGSRGIIRVLADIFRPSRGAGQHVVIYGAGAGGEMALRELRTNADLGQVAVGFLDDDRGKQGTLIHGTPVLGGIDSLEAIVARHGVEVVIVSTGKIRRENEARLLLLARRIGLSVVRAQIEFLPLGEPIDAMRLAARAGRSAQL